MRGMEFDIDQVLNPAAVFDHPMDVLRDPDLTKQEKRAILSAWASDACAGAKRKAGHHSRHNAISEGAALI